MAVGEIVSDMGTHYYAMKPNWRGDKTRKVRVQRFLCLGGEFNQDYRSTDELNDYYGVGHTPYTAFNNAGCSAHSRIFIHDDLIHEDD